MWPAFLHWPSLTQGQSEVMCSCSGTEVPAELRVQELRKPFLPLETSHSAVIVTKRPGSPAALAAHAEFSPLWEFAFPTTGLLRERIPPQLPIAEL